MWGVLEKTHAGERDSVDDASTRTWILDYTILSGQKIVFKRVFQKNKRASGVNLPTEARSVHSIKIMLPPPPLQPRWLLPPSTSTAVSTAATHGREMETSRPADSKYTGLLDNRLFTRATQEVFMLPKRCACNPRGMYLLDIHLGYTSWVTVYTSWITCSSHVLPKRHACNPRGIHVTQELYTSWVYLLGYMHASCITSHGVLPKRYACTQEVWTPENATQEVCTSWVTCIPLG